MPLREPFPGFPPPLTTRPEGLLSMLGLQTNGRYPQHLSDQQLLPQLDLLPWYLESRAEIQSVFGVACNVAPGAFQNVYSVPQQEVWVLLNYTIQGAVIASTQTVQLARVRANDQLSRVALSDPVPYTALSLPLGGSLDAVRYLILRPSVEIGIQCVSGSGVGNTFNTCLRFVRCRI